LMKEYTILPVRFCTIAEDKEGVSAKDRIKEKVLRERYEEFEDLLAEMDHKAELGVKALWTDIDLIFEEILEENKQIRILKKMVPSMKGADAHNETIRLGGLVKSALERKKEKEASKILKPLKKISHDNRINDTFSDRMLLNSAFLVDKDHSEEFDSIVSRLGESHNGRIKFKYVGPVPPANFVEIVVTW